MEKTTRIQHKTLTRERALAQLGYWSPWQIVTWTMIGLGWAISALHMYAIVFISDIGKCLYDVNFQ